MSTYRGMRSALATIDLGLHVVISLRFIAPLGLEDLAL